MARAAAGVTAAPSTIQGFSGEQAALSGSRLLDSMAKSLEVTHSSIRSNQRSDGLTTLTIELTWAVRASPFAICTKCLKAKVAVLSSGALTPDQSLEFYAR